MIIDEQTRVTELAKNKENMFCFSIKGFVESDKKKRKAASFFLASQSSEDVHMWITLLLSVSHFSSASPSFMKLKRLKLKSATRASDELRKQKGLTRSRSSGAKCSSSISVSPHESDSAQSRSYSVRSFSVMAEESIPSSVSSNDDSRLNAIRMVPSSVTRKAKNDVLDNVRSIQSWKFLDLAYGVKMHEHKYSNLKMASTVVHNTPSKVVALFRDGSFTPFWSKQILSSNVLETYDADTDLLQMIWEAPLFQSAPREFIVVREVCPFSNGAYLIVHSSVNSVDCSVPEWEPTPVRCKMNCFAVLIMPYKHFEFASQVTFFSDIEFRCWWSRHPLLFQFTEKYLHVSQDALLFRDLVAFRESVDHICIDEKDSVSDFFTLSSKSKIMKRSLSSTPEIELRLPDSRRRTISNPEEVNLSITQESDFDPAFELGIPDFSKAEGGGMLYTDKEEVQKQRWIAKDVIKSMGSNLMQGKSLIAISMPVKIFEPRSFLQRMTDFWGLLPEYLGRAARLKDPVERMKLVVAFMIGGLHRGVKQRKPFNPVLGETFEGHYADGTKVYLEQISHHPPISAYQVFGPSDEYQFYGYNEYRASLSVNSAIGHQFGPNHVKFNDGSVIRFQMPQTVIKGIVWGNRVIYWKNELVFEDEMNHLKCTIQFQADQASWFSSSSYTLDEMEGNIVNTQTKEVVSMVTGSWVEEICFDGAPYWNLETARPERIKALETSLESDSRKRIDLLKLLLGDLDGAHAAKTELEEAQRRDRKLRTKSSKPL